MSLFEALAEFRHFPQKRVLQMLPRRGRRPGRLGTACALVRSREVYARNICAIQKLAIQVPHPIRRLKKALAQPCTQCLVYARLAHRPVHTSEPLVAL